MRKHVATSERKTNSITSQAPKIAISYLHGLFIIENCSSLSSIIGNGERITYKKYILK